MIEWLYSYPERLLLVDALGAMTSALMMGIVVPIVDDWLGIPVVMSQTLALIPIGMILYDLLSYWRCTHRIAICLKGIAMLNLSYCIISIVHAIYYRKSIMVWGWTYLGLELLILIALIWLEWQLANRSSRIIE